jgi:hypothetical protein
VIFDIWQASQLLFWFCEHVILPVRRFLEWQKKWCISLAGQKQKAERK